MNPNLPEELLSAYFDGELSPEEQAEFLREFQGSGETSAELEQRLQELRQVSHSIKSLPNIPAPSSLHSAVMMRIQPDPSGDSQNTRDASRNGAVAPTLVQETESPSRGGIWQGIASVVVSAVALLIMVQLLTSEDQTSEQDSSQLTITSLDRDEDSEEIVALNPTDEVDRNLSQNSSTPGFFSNKGREEREPWEAELGKRGNELEFQEKGTSQLNKELAKDDLVFGPPGQLAQKSVPFAPTTSPFAPGSVPNVRNAQPGAEPPVEYDLPKMVELDGVDDRETDFLFPEDLKEAEVGQMIEMMETRGDQVVVVRLTVVDRQQGIEHLHLLLSRNKIPNQFALANRQAEIPKESEESKPATELHAEQGANTDLLGVYVQTSSEQLNFALQELQRESNVQAVELESPVEVAQLELQTYEHLNGEFPNQAMGTAPLALNAPAQSRPGEESPPPANQPLPQKPVENPRFSTQAPSIAEQESTLPAEPAPSQDPQRFSNQKKQEEFAENPVQKKPGQPDPALFEQLGDDRGLTYRARLLWVRQHEQPETKPGDEFDQKVELQRQELLARKDKLAARHFAVEEKKNFKDQNLRLEEHPEQRNNLKREQRKTTPLQVLFIVVSESPSSQRVTPAVRNPLES